LCPRYSDALLSFERSAARYATAGKTAWRAVMSGWCCRLFSHCRKRLTVPSTTAAAAPLPRSEPVRSSTVASLGATRPRHDVYDADYL